MAGILAFSGDFSQKDVQSRVFFREAAIGLDFGQVAHPVTLRDGRHLACASKSRFYTPFSWCARAWPGLKLVWPGLNLARP